MGVTVARADSLARALRLDRLGDRLSPHLWVLAVANLVVNVLIVVSGGAVRLTGSGLGCPTWPRCTDDSYVPHGELGAHGVIEFGNRMITFLVAAVALLCILAAWRSGNRRATWLAAAVATIVPAQILIGGITVLTELNPWVVAFHLLVSMAIVGVCVLLLDELRGPARVGSVEPVQRLGLAVFAAAWLVLYLGTVVTGSGPHAGDLDARRTGLDPQVMSHVHAWAVYAMVGLTVALAVVARRFGERRVLLATGALLALEAVQGGVGFTQYYLDLPVLLVAIHMLLAALISAAVTWVLVLSRPRIGSDPSV